MLFKLKPNQTYEAWIRGYTSETLFNQSRPIKIETLPYPEMIPVLTKQMNESKDHFLVIAAFSFIAVFIVIFSCAIYGEYSR